MNWPWQQFSIGSVRLARHKFLTVLLSAAAFTARPAAEPARPVFDNQRALLALGEDDEVYLASKDRVLHCHRDGSQPVVREMEGALTGATASREGIIASSHAHFARRVILHDADFNTLGRFTRIGAPP